MLLLGAQRRPLLPVQLTRLTPATFRLSARYCCPATGWCSAVRSVRSCWALLDVYGPTTACVTPLSRRPVRLLPRRPVVPTVGRRRGRPPRLAAAAAAAAVTAAVVDDEDDFPDAGDTAAEAEDAAVGQRRTRSGRTRVPSTPLSLKCEICEKVLSSAQQAGRPHANAYWRTPPRLHLLPETV